jgi:hypothetical protein
VLISFLPSLGFTHLKWSMESIRMGTLAARTKTLVTKNSMNQEIIPVQSVKVIPIEQEQ